MSRQLSLNLRPPPGVAVIPWNDGTFYIRYSSDASESVERFLIEALEQFRKEASFIQKALKEAPQGCQHPLNARHTNEGKVYCLECKTVLLEMTTIPQE